MHNQLRPSSCGPASCLPHTFSTWNCAQETACHRHGTHSTHAGNCGTPTAMMGWWARRHYPPGPSRNRSVEAGVPWAMAVVSTSPLSIRRAHCGARTRTHNFSGTPRSVHGPRILPLFVGTSSTSVSSDSHPPAPVDRHGNGISSTDSVCVYAATAHEACSAYGPAPFTLVLLSRLLPAIPFVRCLTPVLTPQHRRRRLHDIARAAATGYWRSMCMAHCTCSTLA